MLQESAISIAKSVTPILDLFLPDWKDREDSGGDLTRRARILVTALVGSAPFGVLFGVMIAYMNEAWTPDAVALMLGALLLALHLLWLRLTGRVRRIGASACLVILLVTGIVALYNGGLHAPALAWKPAVVILAGFIVGPMFALLCAAVIGLELFAIYILHHAGIVSAVSLTEDWSLLLYLLAYVTVTFWGFDDRSHTGELLIHRDAAEAVVDVFGRLYEARFPLEEVRVIAAAELDLPPTGDGNVTTGFVCRSTVQGRRWSDHAYGLAVDVNPFHNPYVRGEVVVPELASAYLDRGDHRPGMVQPDDVVVAALAAIGWGWGGDWRSAKDWMHFSASRR
jgi:hypothetical protein